MNPGTFPVMFPRSGALFRRPECSPDYVIDLQGFDHIHDDDDDDDDDDNTTNTYTTLRYSELTHKPLIKYSHEILAKKTIETYQDYYGSEEQQYTFVSLDEKAVHKKSRGEYYLTFTVRKTGNRDDDDDNVKTMQAIIRNYGTFASILYVNIVN